MQWQAQELGVLIHFNIATYISNDGCTDQIVPDISLFDPYLLNTDNWVQTMVDFGAQYAVLVAKVREREDWNILLFVLILACMWFPYGSIRCKVSFESIWTSYSI